MIEVQLAIADLQDRHVSIVPIDARVIVMLEDDCPDRESQDGNG